MFQIKKDTNRDYFWVIFAIFCFLGIGFLVIFAINPFDWNWANKKKTETVSIADPGNQKIILNEVGRVFENTLKTKVDFKIKGYVKRKEQSNSFSGFVTLNKPQKEIFADLKLNLQGEELSTSFPLKISRINQDNFIKIGKLPYFFNDYNKDFLSKEVCFKSEGSKDFFEFSSTNIIKKASTLISKENDIRVEGEGNGRYKKYDLTVNKEKLLNCCSSNNQFLKSLIEPSEKITFVLLVDKNMQPIRLSIKLFKESDYEFYIELISRNLEDYKINKEVYSSKAKDRDRNLDHFYQILKEFFSGGLHIEEWLLNTKEGAKAIAENWIKNKGTTYDEREGSELTLINQEKIKENHFLLKYQFITQKDGYRKVDGRQEKEKMRTMKLEIKDGVIIKAITDEEFNELEGKKIK